MKRIKRAWKLLCYILFILLAAFGAGIGGAIMPTQYRRDEKPDITIEMVDEKKEETAEEKDTLYKF